jgi:hypothetical protein
VIGKTDRWRWFEAGNLRGKTDGACGGLGLDVVPDYTNTTQAKAWVKFPRPFGPISFHLSPLTNHRSLTTDHQSPITDHQSPITDHRSPITDH